MCDKICFMRTGPWPGKYSDIAENGYFERILEKYEIFQSKFQNSVRCYYGYHCYYRPRGFLAYPLLDYENLLLLFFRVKFI